MFRKIATACLLLLVCVGLGAPLIARRSPLVVLGAVRWAAPIPYAPDDLDESSPTVPPFTYSQHLLGTDALGRDVAATLVYGTRTVLLIVPFAMALAFVLGFVLGAVAGYSNGSPAKLSLASLARVCLATFLGIFYGFSVRWYTLADAWQSSYTAGIVATLVSVAITFIVFALVSVFVAMLGKALTYIPYSDDIVPIFFRQWIPIPLDSMILELIKIKSAVPSLVWVLVFASIFRPSLPTLVLVLGFVASTGIARVVRAEVMRVRVLEYITAARLAGFSTARVVWRHVLPNILPNLLPLLAFGAADSITAEATLSFLGVGVPPHVATWGKLIALGRENPAAWWLIAFPAALIALVLLCLYAVGNRQSATIDMGG